LNIGAESNYYRTLYMFYIIYWDYISRQVKYLPASNRKLYNFL